MDQDPLLSVRSLSVRFDGSRGQSGRSQGDVVLRDVDIEVRAAEIVGLIGETGSGKTTLARAVTGLIRPAAGRIYFEGLELTGLSDRDRRAFRRTGKLQLLFQDPLRSLDPDRSVLQLVAEGLTIARRSAAKQFESAVLDTLDLVGLPRDVVSRLPAQISGGQRQRVAIARALILQPRLLLCDEPVSALDVSTRNYVLEMLRDLRDRLQLALVVISHDLASLAAIADRVAVIYRGMIVEEGPVKTIFETPAHPYTALLVASTPSARRDRGELRAQFREAGATQDANTDRRANRNQKVQGAVATGCPFVLRCPFAIEHCTTTRPEHRSMSSGHRVACHRAPEWAATMAGARSISYSPPSGGAADVTGEETAHVR